jgi:DNA-binding PadR family transcriptional regulator
MTVKPAEFTGSRLEVGLSVLDQPRTQYEIAKLQGKQSGSVHGLLRRMVKDGLLKPDSDPPTRGTLYEVHPEAREALLEAAQGFQEPGTLTEHQRLLSVWGGPGRAKAMDLLSASALSGAVSWVARTNSADEMLVAMNPSGDDSVIDALVLALMEAGFDVREGLVAQIQSGREMRDHNKKVAARARSIK